MSKVKGGLKTVKYVPGSIFEVFKDVPKAVAALSTAKKEDKEKPKTKDKKPSTSDTKADEKDKDLVKPDSDTTNDATKTDTPAPLVIPVPVQEPKMDESSTKTKVINEINKTLPIITIDNYINQINGIELKLKELNTNELKFIAEINNLSIKDDDHYLIEEIGTKLDFEIILRSISEISNIKKNVNRFNKLQREHLLIINDLDVSDDNKSQINTILENIELLKIDKFTKMLDDLKEELSNLNIIQLDYILTKHNLEKAADKSIQIDTILENIMIPFIKKDMQTIKSLQNTINTISEDEINSILEEYKLKKSIDKKENIKTIVENLSLNEINECLSKNKTNITSIDAIKDSELICPVKISNGKKIITTTKHENSIFLLLFDNENSFNEYKKDNSFVKKLKKDLDYFKKLINKNKKIKGIIIKKTPEDLIIEKDQL